MTARNFSFSTPLAWLMSRLAQPASDERRGKRRERMRFQAEIEGPDTPTLVAVSGIDIHQQGAMVVSKRPWATGATVCLQLKTFGLAGLAVVRHCTPRKGSVYATGLEFLGPLKRHETGIWEVRRVGHTDGVWTKNDEFKGPIDEFSEVV